MNQIKIGAFIAKKRKAEGLTQADIAEKLNITSKAVSKWECGISMPDSDKLLELCEILKITVNELLLGEEIAMEDYNKKLEESLFEMIKHTEEKDRRLLKAEIILGICCVIPFIAATLIAVLVPMEEWCASLIVVFGLLPLLIMTPFALKIEQNAGYYECKKCGHRYVPKYASVFAAAHLGRNRYMKCPNCKVKSWQKKVVTKED